MTICKKVYIIITKNSTQLCSADLREPSASIKSPGSKIISKSSILLEEENKKQNDLTMDNEQLTAQEIQMVFVTLIYNLKTVNFSIFCI